MFKINIKGFGMIKFLVFLIFLIPLGVQILISYSKNRVVRFRDVWVGVIIGVVGLLFVLVLDQVVRFIVDVLWFSEVGYEVVFWKIIEYKVLIFLLTSLIVFVGFVGFIYLPIKIFFPRFPIGLINVKEFDLMKAIEKFSNILMWLVLLTISAYFGYAAATYDWMGITKFFSRVTTLNYVDPIFGMPAEFYMFSLPFINTVFNNVMWFLFIIPAIMLIVLYIYLRLEHGYSNMNFWYSILTGRIPDKLGKKIYRYSIFILIVWFFVWGLRILLVYPYEIMFVDNGLFSGPGYKEVYAILPLIRISGGVVILLSILAVFFWASNKLGDIIKITGISLGVLLVLLIVYPSLIEVFVVKPSEMDKQSQFIKNNIEATLVAYGLDKVEESFFSYSPLTKDILSKNSDILQNLRLWDWKPLGEAYKQIQTIRFYYKFNDIDVDRYVLDGKKRQVMIAARELDVDSLPFNSRSWINVHFRYTHGIGVVVSPVNEIMENGMPRLFVKDIPPVSSYPELSIDEPRIYFGELTGHYVFVNSKLEEFDYPSSEGSGEENVYTRYKGKAGIKIDSFIKKVIFALYLNEDIKVLFSEYIDENTKILLFRNILERVDKIMPFLYYDDDPYIVISKGKLYWIIDAYTTSDSFPYAKVFGKFSYIRNPIKVVVSAYDGTVEFYLVDPKDPVINVFKNMLGIKFKDISEMDPDLRAHIRYPEKLLNIQARIYRIYHMKDPNIFFNQEDVWSIAKEIKFGNRVDVEPYYILTRLPKDQDLKFVLVLPFNPKDKDNLVAWMAVMCDPDEYGKIVVYRMPKDKLVFGPLQIEARISQDPEISAQITLWNQQGSQVLRGNLIILPIGESLFYYEPIYLQAEVAKIPEFRRIAVSDGERVTWDDSVGKAISKLFALSSTSPVIQEMVEKIEKVKIDKNVILKAIEYIESYKNLTGKGDFVEAARKLKELEEFLKRMLKE